MSRQDAREHHIALMNIRPQPVDIDVPFQLNLCHLRAPVRAVRDLRRASAHSLYTHESTGSQLSMLRSKSGVGIGEPLPAFLFRTMQTNGFGRMGGGEIHNRRKSGTARCRYPAGRIRADSRRRGQRQNARADHAHRLAASIATHPSSGNPGGDFHEQGGARNDDAPDRFAADSPARHVDWNLSWPVQPDAARASSDGGAAADLPDSRFSRSTVCAEASAEASEYR